MTGARLGQRQEEILRFVVRHHVLTRRPASSREVADATSERLSPATVRHIMADLEQGGYLEQPHTSAGRMPTKRGYRYYVDVLLAREPLPGSEQALVRTSLSPLGDDLPGLMGKVSLLLSRLSHQVGVVLSPCLRRSAFPRVELHRLEGFRVLAIFVDPGGLPHGRILAASRDHSQPDLDRMGAALERRFAGGTPEAVRKRPAADAPAGEESDPLLWRQARGLLEDSRGPTGGEDAVFVEGTEDLLNDPEFADVGRLRSLFRAVHRRQVLVETLRQCMAPVGVQVHIGSEALAPDLSEFALVTSTYGPCDCPLGSLGILGPIRMEYDRAIAVVEFVSGYFSRLLTGPAC